MIFFFIFLKLFLRSTHHNYCYPFLDSPQKNKKNTKNTQKNVFEMNNKKNRTEKRMLELP